MKKFVLGVGLVEMTEEEIEGLRNSEKITYEPTQTERIEALEGAVLELAEVIVNG